MAKKCVWNWLAAIDEKVEDGDILLISSIREGLNQVKKNYPGMDFSVSDGADCVGDGWYETLFFITFPVKDGSYDLRDYCDYNVFADDVNAWVNHDTLYPIDVTPEFIGEIFDE